MINFSQIYEGWRNKLIPPADMKDMIQQVSKERVTICNDCPFHSKNHKTPLRPDAHCTDCGCNLEAKSACLSCNCPQGKWLAVVDQEEEEQLKSNIDG